MASELERGRVVRIDRESAGLLRAGEDSRREAVMSLARVLRIHLDGSPRIEPGIDSPTRSPRMQKLVAMEARNGAG